MPTVLITGANRGIGLALTRSFAADGWRVLACCRNPERADDLRAVRGAVEVHRLDVNDGPMVADLASTLGDQAIDILLNNAGIYGPRAGFGETDYGAWQAVLATNTFAPLRLAECFVEQVARSERKLILNMSSRVGSIGESSGGAYVYRASKAALNVISKNLSLDLAARGITVVALHPGWVKTDMGGPRAQISAEESARGLRQVIDGLTAKDNGRFFAYDGREIPW